MTKARLSLSFLLVFSSSLALGCGDDGRPGAGSRGYTDCGGVTCSPGQYCNDPRFAECYDGCLSDANCLDNQRCATEAASPTCVNVSGPPATPDGGASTGGLGACQAACDHFQTCGLGAADTADCRTGCSGLTPDQQQVIANCGGVACTSVMTCLGIACLNDSDCAAGESCLSGDCL
jgi:hypothetical protein